MRSIALAVLLSTAAISLHAADIVIGTWNLNLSKSRYDPGPPPASQTRTYREEKGELKAIITTVYKNGNSDTVHYPANYDGKEYPVSGSPDTDGISMKRVDEYTAESLIMHAGRPIGTTRRVVSRDGQTMTITFKGVGELGEQVNNTAVYTKLQ
ncbi:MAG: hypothetical protein ABI811_02585 [Acidobacteriota bacterium]